MWLVSCGSDLKLHNCTNYEICNVYRPSDSTGQIRSISWCKDGSWLALVPTHGNAEIIRTKDDIRLLQSILGIPYPTTAVFQKTTKKNIAMSTVNGDVFVYDIKARNIKKHFTKAGVNGSVTMMDWSIKDTHLVTGSTDGQVTVYSNTTNQKISAFALPSSKSVSVVRFHSTQRSILGTASDEGVVVVWDINNESKKISLRPHKAPVTDLVFSSQNRNLMVSVGLDRTYQCYDVNAGAVALSVLVDHPLSTVDMAPDGYTVAVGSSRGTVYIYDLRDHLKPLATIPAHSGEIKKVLYQPFSLDNSESVNITEQKSTESNTHIEPKHSTSTDSFNLNMIPEFTPQIDNIIERMDQDPDPKTKSVTAAGDSFFSYLDNCDNCKRISGSFTKEKSEMTNLGISDGVKKWLDSKQQIQTDVPSTAQSVDETGTERLSDIPAIAVNATSSTPRQITNAKISSVINLERNISNISPINSGGPHCYTNEELNALVKKSVNDVIKEHMNELMDALSTQFLNLQLSICKQFVNQEIQIERLEDCLQSSSNNSNLSLQYQQLQQENEFLKAKINELLRKK